MRPQAGALGSPADLARFDRAAALFSEDSTQGVRTDTEPRSQRPGDTVAVAVGGEFTRTYVLLSRAEILQVRVYRILAQLGLASPFTVSGSTITLAPDVPETIRAQAEREVRKVDSSLRVSVSTTFNPTSSP
jgi:hypothetical protein